MNYEYVPKPFGMIARGPVYYDKEVFEKYKSQFIFYDGQIFKVIIDNTLTSVLLPDRNVFCQGLRNQAEFFTTLHECRGGEFRLFVDCNSRIPLLQITIPSDAGVFGLTTNRDRNQWLAGFGPSECFSFTKFPMAGQMEARK